MNQSWFIKLRYFAFSIYLSAILITYYYFSFHLNYKAILILLFLIPISNLFSKLSFFQNNSRNLCITLLLLDTFILTGFIYYSGGASNPLSIIYLLQVVLAAVILDKKWTWIFFILTSTCFLILFKWNYIMPGHHHHGHNMELHLQGMYVAYLIVGLLTSYFLTNLLNELEKQKTKIQKMYFNNEKLAAITSVSANTAHELGTPLASINLLSEEILDNIKDDNFNIDDLKNNLNLINDQTLRCKNSINKLCESSGINLGEKKTWIKFNNLINSALQDYIGKINLENKIPHSLEIEVPVNSITSVIRSLVKNAIESESEQKIEINTFFNKNELNINIRDFGAGLKEEVLNNIGEPFISTKENGMGLGIYIAKLSIENLNGTINFSNLEQGVSVEIKINLNNRNV